MKYEPIIIIGMHRSGTSLLTTLLSQLGLFTGREKDRNAESLFFLRLNRWLLRQAGGAWDQPEPFYLLLDNVEVRTLNSDYLRYLIRTPQTIRYLGLKNYLRYRGLASVERPWGWKDPRNTFTLPIWLDLFPEAKIVHIYRHGVDVASSLRVRESRRLRQATVLHQRRKRLRAYWFRQPRGAFSNSLRCFSLEEAFDLWYSYLMEAQHHVEELGDECAFELKYEVFLDEPVQSLLDLAQFCQLEVSVDQAKLLANGIDRSRAFAYRSDKELLRFAETVRHSLQVAGY